MTSQYIWIQGERYYLYDKYETWRQAYNMGRYQKRKNRKCQYYILTTEQGLWFPEKRYVLYLNRVCKLW